MTSNSNSPDTLDVNINSSASPSPTNLACGSAVMVSSTADMKNPHPHQSYPLASSNMNTYFNPSVYYPAPQQQQLNNNSSNQFDTANSNNNCSVRYVFPQENRVLVAAATDRYVSASNSGQINSQNNSFTNSSSYHHPVASSHQQYLSYAGNMQYKPHNNVISPMVPQVTPSLGSPIHTQYLRAYSSISSPKNSQHSHNNYHQTGQTIAACNTTYNNRENETTTSAPFYSTIAGGSAGLVGNNVRSPPLGHRLPTITISASSAAAPISTNLPSISEHEETCATQQKPPPGPAPVQTLYYTYAPVPAGSKMFPYLYCM